MIGLFKNNNPLALLALAFIAALPFITQQGAAHAPDIPQDATSMGRFFIMLMDSLGAKNPTLNNIAAVVVLFVEALLVNKIVVDYKLLDRTGLIPALSFLLLHALVPSPISGIVLFGNLITILVIRILISTYKNDKPNNSLLAAGFMTGLLALINTPFAVLYIWVCVSILIMRPASLKEWLLTTAGFGMPFYFLSSGLYLTDQFEFNKLLTKPDLILLFPILKTGEMLRIALFLGMPLLGMVLGNSIISKMMILNRKSYIILLIHFLLAGTLCIGEMEAFPGTLHIMLISASVMLSLLFMSSKRDFIPNLLFWLLIALSVIR